MLMSRPVDTTRICQSIQRQVRWVSFVHGYFALLCFALLSMETCAFEKPAVKIGLARPASYLFSACDDEKPLLILFSGLWSG